MLCRALFLSLLLWHQVSGFTLFVPQKSRARPIKSSLFAASTQLLPGQVLVASTDKDSFDSQAVAYPVVLPPVSGNDDDWIMFYYGHDGTWENNTQPFLPTGYVGKAVSKDGINWTRVKGPLEQGAILRPSTDPADFDSLHIGVSDVIRLSDSNTLQMYYLGASLSDDAVSIMTGIPAAKGVRMRIGRAESKDNGMTWTKLGMVLDYDEENEGFFCSWPRIIPSNSNDKPWLMVYHAFNGQKYRVFGAKSNDQGGTWTRTGLQLQGGEDPNNWDIMGIGTRCVIPNNNGNENSWLMIYEAVNAQFKHQIGVAVNNDIYSNDSKWEKLNLDEPLFKPGEAPLDPSWTDLVIGTPHVVKYGDSGSYRMYYVSRSSKEGSKMAIGMLENKSGDLLDKNAWKTL